MQRRDFLRMLGTATLAAAAFPRLLGERLAMAQAAPIYNGPILITFHARGGWDASSFADPRENANINHWAAQMPAGTAGNLRYAPLGENAAFFTKYANDMLVINGIDIQSGSHSAGARNRTTGRLAGGYPQLNELFAAVNGQGMPMAFVNASGYSIDTVGLAARSNLPDENTLRTIATPNNAGQGNSYLRPTDFDTIRRYQDERLTALRGRTDNLPRWQTQLDTLDAARNSTTGLNLLAQSLPTGGLDRNDLTGNRNNMVSGLHMYLVTAAAGLTTTATFGLGGWDTHDDHENRHSSRLNQLTRSLDYLWDKATQLGLADRLIVHITSDVGRTPHYNARNGKDHWQVGSDIIMRRNVAWTNRIVGASGPGHEAFSIDPVSLAVDNNNGTPLQPKHVQSELRKLLGLDGHPLAQQFPLDAAPVALFDGSVSTGIVV